MVPEAECESRAPSPIAIQAAAGAPLRPISQLRHVPSDEHRCTSHDLSGAPPSCCLVSKTLSVVLQGLLA